MRTRDLDTAHGRARAPQGSQRSDEHPVAWTQRLLTRIWQIGGTRLDLVIFCVGFALLRGWTSLGRPPVSYPDTGTYMQLNFLGQGGVNRLWTVPLLFTTLPTDSTRAIAQLVIGIVCWSCLALAVGQAVGHPVTARVGSLLVLMLGLCIQVTQWDQVLLSESLAISLTALLVSCLLWVRASATPLRLAALVLVLTLWVFNRQLQATIFLPISVVVIGWILIRRRSRRFVVVAAALAILAAWGSYATAKSSPTITRWNAHNLLVIRLLPEAAGYFAERGIPDMPALSEEAKKRTDLGSNDPVLNDPAFLKWVDNEWQRAYAGWLVRHPVDVIRGPLLDAPTQMSGFYSYASVRPALPGAVQDALWDRTPGGGDVPFFFVLTLLLWAASLVAGRPDSRDALGFVLVAIAIVWYYAGWHGVASDLARISTPAASLLRISLLIVSLVAVDRLVTARERTHPRARVHAA